MDYSLFVGVKRKLFSLNQDFSSSQSENALDSGLISSTAGGSALHAAAVQGAGTFHIGLIDLLQEWNWAKWLEYVVKVYFLRKDGRGISSVEPGLYRSRFMSRAVVDVFDGIDSIPTIIEEDDDDVSSVGSRRVPNGRSLQVDGTTEKDSIDSETDIPGMV
jgi:hypothetical protein